jgi:lipoprotein-anchoring transpeptidase ErfK/SrfK
MTVPNSFRLLRYFLFGLAVFVAGALLTLGGVAYVYRNSFYPGVKVGTVALSGVAEGVGKQTITTTVARYAAHPVIVTIPKITEPRNEATGQYPDLEIQTTAGELGIAFQQNIAISKAWEVGHQRNIWQWTKSVFNTLFAGNKQPLLYTVDQNKVSSFIHTKVTPQVTTPTPAKIVVQGVAVSISDQRPGLSIDTTTLTTSLANSLAAATDKDTTYIRAPIMLGDSPVGRTQIEPTAAQLDALGNLAVTLTTDSLALKPTREDLLTWFTPVQNDKGEINLSLSQDAISGYLDKNGNKSLDTQKSAISVITGLSGYVKPGLSAAQYTNPVSVVLTPKPVATVAPGTFTLNEFPGKYIEVNLSEQKMYLINGGTLEQTYIVSSGYWSTPTPVGRFHIANKSPRAYSAEFGLYMPYWQNFIDDAGKLLPGDYGLHGLPEWPNGYKEGENHLGVPVSHGCVRLGIGPDAFVYNWTEIGTPVITF